jgi:hypothetical protein
MLAAIDWQSYLLGVATIIILVGAVLGAFGQIGRAWTWIREQISGPPPPRFDLENSGGQSSHERDEATGEITWTNVRPTITIRNNEPVAVYAVSVGVVNPARDERIEYPGCPIPIVKAETHLDLGSTEGFKIPSDWLAGVAPGNEHKGVPYFVTLTDANNREWDGVIDFRETIPRLQFRRVKR